MRGALLLPLALAACSAPATNPTSPSGPADPSATTPANIAGEWIDTSSVNAWVDIWHIAQSGTALSVVDSLYDGTVAQGYTFASSSVTAATIVGDSINLPVTCSNCAGETIAYARGQTIALYNLAAGCSANDSAGSPCDTAGSATIYTRGTWSPPADPTSTAVTLNGVYESDSLPWTELGQPCQGTIQIDLVIDGAGDGYPNAPAGGYMSTEYDRQCGGTWQAAIANWVVIDTGRVTNGVLVLSEQELPNGYTGPFTTAGNNWHLQVISSDSLQDVTPTTVNLGWLPPAFVYQPQGFGGATTSGRLMRPAYARRTSARSPTIR